MVVLKGFDVRSTNCSEVKQAAWIEDFSFDKYYYLTQEFGARETYQAGLLDIL